MSSLSRIRPRLVMSSSSSNSSDSIIHVESFVTRSMSNGEREGGDSDGPSYDWVDPSVLKIPTKFRDSNMLDQFLSTTFFNKPDCPTDAVMVDICGHTDRVCHGQENAPQDFCLRI